MEYPVDNRVSDAITAKSGPAIAKHVLQPNHHTHTTTSSTHMAHIRRTQHCMRRQWSSPSNRPHTPYRTGKAVHTNNHDVTNRTSSPAVAVIRRKLPLERRIQRAKRMVLQRDRHWTLRRSDDRRAARLLSADPRATRQPRHNRDFKIQPYCTTATLRERVSPCRGARHQTTICVSMVLHVRLGDTKLPAGYVRRPRRLEAKEGRHLGRM